MELSTTNAGADVNFVMLNMSRPPFDQPIARVALAHAIDIEKIIADTQHGLVTRAVQPFSKGTIGYTDPKQVDFPAYDQRAARTLVRQYEQQVGHGLTFQLVVPDDPTSRRIGQLMRAQVEAAGMHVDLEVADTISLTNAAVAGDFGAVLWRSYPGGDPDTQSVWWRARLRDGRPNAADFARIDDPELDRLLADGRSEPDPTTRRRIYEGVTARFAQQVYNSWGWYTTSAVGSARDVQGLAPLPLASGEQPVSLAGFQPVVGLWKR